MGDMLSDAVAMSDAGKVGDDKEHHEGNQAQLESLAALIYHLFTKRAIKGDDGIDPYAVANDWFEAVWEITPYEAQQYGYDFCEAVYGRCVVNNKQ